MSARELERLGFLNHSHHSHFKHILCWHVFSALLKRSFISISRFAFIQMEGPLYAHQSIYYIHLTSERGRRLFQCFQYRIYLVRCARRFGGLHICFLC